MKWQFHFYDEDQIVLECVDAGAIHDICLRQSVDNYPYVEGAFMIDALHVSTCIKLSAMNAYGGLPIFAPNLRPLSASDLEPVLPETIPVTYWDRRSERSAAGDRERPTPPPETLPREKVCALLAASTAAYSILVSDPRVLFLAYTVLLDSHRALFQRLTATPPTHEKAVRLLSSFGLLSTPFCPYEQIDEHFYTKINHFATHMIAEHAPDLAEMLAVVHETRPTPKCEHVKVAGVFAIDQPKAVLHRLQPFDPVLLEREPTNAHDPNAIRLYAIIQGLGKTAIGYLPKTLAKTLAPKLDAQSVIIARVEAVDPKEMAIDISLTPPSDAHWVNHLTLTWGDFPNKRHTLELSEKGRELRYRYQADYFTPQYVDFHLRFTPEAWEEYVVPLIWRCNFPTWEYGYRSTDIHRKALLWKMRARSNHAITESFGCDASPIAFSHVIAFIRDCLDLTHPKGACTLNIVSDK